MIENNRDFNIKVPHRITGFFEIINKNNKVHSSDPANIGSRGVGFTLNAFGTTIINTQALERNNDTICNIYINGEKLDQKAGTSYYIFNSVKHLIRKPRIINVYHNFELPVESGYGASGSGALGLIFGLNKILNLGFTIYECGRIAHVSEVINKTGLGTVCGQLNPGLSILKEGGYPCVCEKIYVPKNIRVITTSFGKISTTNILADEKVRSVIIKVGKDIFQRFIKNPNINTFAELSLEFVEKTNLINLLDLVNVQELLSQLKKEKIIGASMNQLGRSIYAICEDKDIRKIEDIFESYQNKKKIYILKIDEKGFKM